LFVAHGVNIQQLVESTAIGLGYELVDLDLGPRARRFRVFIDRAASAAGIDRAASAAGIDRAASAAGTDRAAGAADTASTAGGITLDDCQRMTRQLQRVLEVEGVDYDRLEVSSPGLDRVLKKPADFRRFSGDVAEVRLRVPLNGRRRFVGVVRAASDAAVDLEVDGAVLSLAYVNMDKARLVPKL
jgi:ribosome maturation factor RimP